MSRYILYFVFALLPVAVAAQHITFENMDEFRKLGVYDGWEQSPFRTGAIDGSHFVKITANPNSDEQTAPGIATNASEKAVALQRSRYGSNTFGARIDLNEPLHLGTSKKYVHVLVNKPAGEEAQVMLMGLGKREDWENQKPETEQFWVTSSIGANDVWCDLVFPITTNDAVDIHSFVLVPDLASPHLRTTDFIAYIDDIEVTDSSQPRYQEVNYPVNFDANQAPTRTDRKTTKLNFTVTNESAVNVTVPTTTVYTNLTEKATVFAKAGAKVTPKITYTGNWMSGYAYVDWNNDGQFTPIIENNKAAEGSELVSYTFLDGYDSTGATKSNGNSVSNGTITCPAFTIPADTKPGIYRMRLKVDWNSADAGGNNNTGNLIVDNGGAIIDVLLNVHADEVAISANQLNGDVLSAEGAALSDAPVPFAKPVTVKMSPAPDFTYTGIIITHGYNLDGPEYVRENRQYSSVTIPASSFDSETHEYTIPATYIDGEVRIEGLFTPGGDDPGPGPDDPDPLNPTYTVTYKKDVEGTFLQGGSEVELGKGWAAAEWVSAEPAPVVTISGDRNNAFNTTNFNLGRDFKFTISVEGEYNIIGYKISTTNGWGTTVVTENEETAVFSGEQSLTVSGLKTTSTWFTTADANLNGPVIDVYLVDAEPTGISQLGEKDIILGLYSIDGRRLTKAPEKGVYIMRTMKPGTQTSETRKVLSNGR